MGDPRDKVQWSGVQERAGVEDDPQESDISSPPVAVGTPYLRLWFTCSGQYARAYRSQDGRLYLGRCPKCGGTARFPVGSGGTSERFFRVSC